MICIIKTLEHGGIITTDIFQMVGVVIYLLIYFSNNFTGSAIPELKNQVKKPSYGLWHHKSELSQIMTS